MSRSLTAAVCIAYVLFGSVADIWAQNSAAQSGHSLIGTWSSTAKQRGGGVAPAIAPTFVIQVIDGSLSLLIAGSRETPQIPTVFKAGKEAILFFKGPPSIGRGVRMIIIRPTGVDEVRFELYMEYPESSSSNFYYAETFKRTK